MLRDLDQSCHPRRGTTVQVSCGDKPLLPTSHPIIHNQNHKWTIKPHPSFPACDDARYRIGTIEIPMMNEEALLGGLHMIYTHQLIFHLFRLYQLQRRSIAASPTDMDMPRIQIRCPIEATQNRMIVVRNYTTTIRIGMNMTSHITRTTNHSMRTNTRISILNHCF